MNTYLDFLVKMAYANDIIEFWQNAIDKDLRKDIAYSLLNYISSTFDVRYSSITGKKYFNMMRLQITMEQSERIYDFLTSPVIITKTFAWE